MLPLSTFGKYGKGSDRKNGFFLIPEDEDVEDGQVERQTERELPNHHPGEDFICGVGGCFAVVD